MVEKNTNSLHKGLSFPVGNSALMQSTFFSRYRLWLAILASALGHLLLFWPGQTEEQRLPLVIHATLQEPTPKQSQFQPAITPSQKDSSQDLSAAKPKLSAQNSNKKASQNAPKAHRKTASSPAPRPTLEKADERPAQNLTPGLVFSKDEEAVDPLERSYQQLVLAHLRQNVKAPVNLNGSVRLELAFSYGQMVTQVRVIRSSGDANLDDWAIKAVLSANPYPPMPKGLGKNYRFRPTLSTQ